MDQLEKIVEEFENAWNKAKHPKIDDFLPVQGEDRLPVLIELVHTDLERRLKAAQKVRVDIYLKNYPELRHDAEVVMNLLVAEFKHRRRNEPDLDLAEYQKRFPEYFDELADRLQVAASRGSSATFRESGRSEKHAGSISVPSPITSVQVLEKQLRDQRLFNAEQLAALGRLDGKFAEPWDLAHHLMQRGWLTGFQVFRLLDGRGNELFQGPYLLLEPLGKGGMGLVYKARHQVLDRLVALKVIPPECLQDSKAVRRFHREIQATSQLDHPNIVRALAADHLDGVHFLAMEYVEGKDLSKMLKQSGPLSVPQVCDYARQAALGLQHAHEHGLVHRDIKPSNLILKTRGEVLKILDMGLARWSRNRQLQEASTALTTIGTVVGTPDYIAPEQTIDASAVDIRADLYSLGCTMYHLLTGKAPFAGRNLTEKLLLHRQAEVPPLAQTRPNLPPQLGTIVSVLLAKNPQDRYQTPAELATVLTNLQRNLGRR